MVVITQALREIFIDVNDHALLSEEIKGIQPKYRR